MSKKALFESLRLGSLELSNRMAMAPMTRNRAGAGGVPTRMNATYYAQRASAGLIVTEAAQVSPQGVGYPGTPGLHDAAQIGGWRRVVRAVHERQGRIFAQLFHSGRISHPSLQPNGARPVAPSALTPDGEVMTPEGLQAFEEPRALATDEVPAVVAEFADAARGALEAGFDGVEIHAANGYLIDQFLRDSTNRRSDAYGGSVENRARLLLEITEAVCDVWGADRVGVRLSPTNPFNDISDSDPRSTFAETARRLDPFGLGYLHLVETPRDERVTAAVREAFGGPLMLNGGYDAASAGRALVDGAADLVSFGVLFLANPDLPRRFAEGAPLNEPHSDTFYGGGAEGYIDYPTLETARVAAESRG